MVHQMASMAHHHIFVEQNVLIQILIIGTFKYKISLIIYDKKGRGFPFK